MNGINQISGETVALIQKMQADRPLGKATVDVSFGLMGYNLEVPLMSTVPTLSYMRSLIGRRERKGQGTNYKVLTAITPTGDFGVAEGTKANSFTLTKRDGSVAYKSIGRSYDVTWEAQSDSQNFAPTAEALAEAKCLSLFAKEQSLVMVGGNVTLLAAVTGLVNTAADTGGHLVAGTYDVKIVALTAQLLDKASLIKRVPKTYLIDTSLDDPALPAVVSTKIKGATAACAAVQGTVGAVTTGKLTVTWDAVPGAAGYAVYMDNSTTVGLQAVVTQTKVIIDKMDLTPAAQAPPSADDSAELCYDGMIQLIHAGTGVYKKRINAQFSAAVGGGIPEIDAMLFDLGDRSRGLSPDALLCGWPELVDITNKLAAVSADRLNLNIQLNGEQGPKFGQIFLKTYRSPIDGSEIPIRAIPELRGGTMIAMRDSQPYPDSDLPRCWEVLYGAPVQRLDYAMTAPSKSAEIRAREALVCYAPPFQGILYDIHAGEPQT